MHPCPSFVGFVETGGSVDGLDVAFELGEWDGAAVVGVAVAEVGSGAAIISSVGLELGLDDPKDEGIRLVDGDEGCSELCND